MADRPFTVLIVDDDADDIALSREMLLGLGFPVEVAAAGGGREALAFLARAPRPGLILLDLNMPVMDGWELLRAVKGDPELRAIPTVIFSTAYGSEEVARSRALGADGFVKKPLLLDRCGELAAVVGKFREAARGG